MSKSRETVNMAFALGGLAGNNAFGAGFLEAALDHQVTPSLMSCSSGQIYWVYRYLQARDHAGEPLSDILAREIEEMQPFHQPDADLARLILLGYDKRLRPATYEVAIDSLKNLLGTFVDIAHGRGGRFYLKQLFEILPARTLVPLFSDAEFDRICEVFNQSPTAILFNSYDPRQGIEYVHLNPAARKLLGLQPGDKKTYRSRTIYRDITATYVRDGLWLYQYGFADMRSAIDGAYYRQIILSELANAERIFVVRPINEKWLGDLPTSLLALEDLKTELGFNATYHGERDRLLLVNKWLKDGVLPAADFHTIEIFEVDIETQESFFDYVFESMDVFTAAREKAARAFNEELQPMV